MQRLIVLVLVLAMPCSAAPANAEENMGSANYMLPLCKTWLKIGIEKDVETIKNILKTDPVQLTTSGMCAGVVVVGIEEALRMLELLCPPEGVTNDQLVRMVVARLKRHPEWLHEDFIVPASAAMEAAWPCHK